jgi:hypothetical protein
MGENRRSACAYCAFVVAILLPLTTCDAFKAGLGPKIDITGPTVSVGSIANGAYLRGMVTLTGDDADVLNVQSVSVIVSINSAQVKSIPATLSNGTWSALLNTVELSGGKDTQASLDIKVTAGSGKVSDENLVVYFDNTAPAFTSMTPSQAQLGDNATYDYALSQTELITGSINDFGLSSVELDMGKTNNIVLKQMTKSGFSFSVDATKFYYASTFAANNGATQIGSGLTSIYSVPYTIIATDLAGNTTTLSGKSFYVKPGTGAPLVTFTSPSVFYADVYYPNPPPSGSSSAWLTNTVKPNSSITFHVFDMDGLDTGDSGLFVALAPKSSVPDYTDAFNPASPGPYTVYTVGNGGLSKTTTTTATITLSDGTTKSITQGADFSLQLPSVVGEYAIMVHAADDPSNKAPTGSGAAATAAAQTIPAGPSASAATLNSIFVSLYISNSNPTVYVSSPNDGSYLTSFAASGKVADTIGVDQLLVSITSSDGTTIADNATANLAAPTGSTYPWTYSYPSLPDGTYTASFQGKNNAGAFTLTPVTRVFNIDTTAPATSISQPGNYAPGQSLYWLSGATASVGGTSADAGSGVAGVYYTIVPKGSPQPAFSTTSWTLAAGTGSWNSTASLSGSDGLGEGQFTLYAAAIDRCGNVETAKTRDFGVDQDPPTLTEINHPALSYTKSDFSLKGDVGDSDALASLAITESKNGGAAQSVGLSPPISLAGVKSATYISVDLPLGGATDGSYAYTLTAVDVAGKTTTVNRTVKIDTTPPAVTLAAIPSWISSAAYTISGSGTDPNSSSASGVATVQYQLDGGAWANAAWADTSGGANTSGNWNVTLSGLAEGYHALKVQATDAAGNSSALASASFGVDLNSPNLAVGAVPATITAGTGTAFTGFSGTIFDTDPAGVASLAVTSTQNGAIVANNAAIPYPGTSNSSGNPWALAFGIDTVGHSTDGLWTFTFSATDISGKTTTVIKNITIDTEPPTTTVTSPSSAGWVSTNSLSVTGVASDGTGTGVSKVYVKTDGLYVTSSSTDHSGEDPVADGWTQATGKTSWSASLTLTGEGRKTLWIKALDAAGNITTPADAVASRVDFGLDLNPPALGFSDATSTLVNAGFTLAGGTSDSNPAGLPALAVTVDGGTSQAVAVTAAAWTFPVAVDAIGHANDGSHTYVFTATDVAGKTTTLSRTIAIDTTFPTTSIGQPGNYAAGQSQYWLSGATATMSGSASDAGKYVSGVAKVYYKVDAIGNSHASDDSSTIASTWTLATGTGNWSSTINLSSEGQFTLWTAAYDNAGNLSAISSRNFGADQNPPTLTETNHPATSSTKAAYTLAGSIGDTNSLGSLTITESKNGGTANSVTFASTPSSLSGNQSATYISASLPFGVGSIDTVGHTNDGSYAYVLTATDIAGKTTVVNRTVNIDTTPPTVALNAVPAWISATAYTISGTATDPSGGASGIATIQYQLDGGAWANATWTDTSGGHNTSGAWSATLSALAEENHSLVVRANDAASNTTTLGASSFGVDLNPPAITETALGTTAQVTKNASFTMTGSISDTNPASIAGTSLLVSVSVNGGAATPATIVGSTWSYTQAKVDGSYSYLITATDVSGKTTSLNRLALLDSTPPILGVASPTPSPGTWVSSTTLALGGSAQDGAGSGVKNIYYLVDVAANDHSADVAAWNLTNGASAPTVGWTATTGLPGSWTGSSTLAGEGAKILWIVAADKAGNTTALSKVAAGSFNSGTVYTIASIGTTDFTVVGASSNTVGLAFTATGTGSGTGSAFAGTGIAIPFGLDLNPPNLAENAINTTLTVVRNSSVTFSGSASDTNALAAAHNLTVSIDGGAATDVSFTVAPAWSYIYAVNGSTHAQDGTHSFVFTATDVAGKTTALTRTVLVDTTPATAVVTAPAASAWTGASPYTVAGTASDGAGTGVSQVWTIVDAPANSHAADTINAITTGGAWKQAAGSNNWSASWTLSPEGAKTLWVAVLDSAGNWSSAYTSVSFGFDATSPVLTVNTLGAYNQGFNITGTSSDAASGVSSIKLNIDSGSASDVTVAGSWSFGVPAATISGLSEGAHTATLIAVDAAGNQSTQTTTFRKDSQPPTVAYNNLATDGTTVIQDPSPKITGTISDASGVASMNGTLEQWNYATSTWATVAGMNNASLGAPGGAASATFSIDMSASGLNLADGKYRLSIVSVDVSTPVNTLATTAIPFMIARSAPTLTIGSPSAGVFERQAFTLTGTASDNNGVTGVIAQASSGSITFNGTATAAIATRSATLTASLFTTAIAHGLAASNVVFFAGTVPTIGGMAVSGATPYYVISTGLTAKTFKVSATSGGGAITFDADIASGLLVGSSSFAFSYPSAGWMVPALTSMSGFADGSLSAYVQAASGSGRTTVTSVAFTKDSTAPTIAVTSPASGARSVGNLTILGTSTDPGMPNSGVTGTIQYKVGLDATSWTSTNVSGGAYSWTITLGDMSAYARTSSATKCNLDGSTNPSGIYWNLPIYFLATDNAGNVGQLSSYFLVLDPNGNVPVVTMTSPTQNGLTYGGQQRITGTATQPVWIHDVEVAVDPANAGNYPDSPTSLTIAGSTLTAASVPFVNGQAVYLSGSTAPQIGGVSVSSSTPYYVLNKGATTFQLSIAPYGSAASFSSAGAGVTASVWTAATVLSPGSNVSWYCDVNAGNVYPENGATTQTVGVQVRAWSSLTVGGARSTVSGMLTNPLTMNFNSTYPKIQDLTVSPTTNFADPGAKPYYSQITVSGTFYALAHIVSSKGISKIERVGDPLYGTAALYDTSSSYTTTNTATTTVTPPTIYTSGSFPTAGSTQLIITSLGSTNWQSIGAPAGAAVGTVFHPTGAGDAGGGQAIASDSSGNFTYTVAIKIDSTALYATNSGYHVFDLRATDMTSPVSQVSSQTITLAEDNYYPTSTLSSPASPGYVLNGSVFKVQGSATDVGASSGPIAGLSKIVVYLARGSSILNINTGSGTSAGTPLANVTDMAAGGAKGTLSVYPTAETAGVAHNYYASIDDRNEVGVTDHNGDGFVESLLANGNNLDWWAQIDTTKLSDGPVDVHYVIWDNAGNATHYKQAAMISNWAPKLSSITIGTDLNGDGTITSMSPVETQSFSSGYATTGFLARNNRLSFEVASNYNSAKNGNLSYSLKYNGNEYWGQTGTTVTGGGSTSDATLTIDFTNISPAITDAALNAAVFTLTVTDATSGSPQSYSQAINIGIQNKDTTKPSINVAPFGERYGAGTTDSAKILGLVGDYTENLGGGSVSNGHVEYGSVNPLRTPASVNATAMVAGVGYTIVTQGTTDFTLVGAAAKTAGTSFIATGAGSGSGVVKALDNAPALSGQVVFRGKAWDNQRINRITATIPNFDGGNGAGVEFEIAKWSGSGLLAESNATSGKAWTFAMDGAETVDLTNGDFLNWSLTWDTSQISTVAASGQTATFTVYDFMYSGTGTRTANTIASPAFSGMTILNGTAIAIGSGGSYTWTTVSSFAGTTITLTNGTIPLANTSYILANSSSQNFAYDIAPYVTQVVTPLSSYYASAPSVFSRTAKGHYPVAENAGLTLNGFNFATPTTFTVAATSITPTVTGTTQMTFNTGTTAVSGALTLAVGGVNALNNTNSNFAPWNQQPNKVNNNLLNDDIYLDIWNFQEAGWSKSGSGINNPSMKVGPKGQIGFAFGHSIVYYSMPGLDSTGTNYHTQTPFEMNYGWFTSNNFCFDPQGNTYGVALCPDTSGSPGQTANMAFFTREASGTLANMGLNNNYNCANNNGSNTAAPYAYRIMSTSRVLNVDNSVAIAANAMVKGNTYQIHTVGTTNFTTYGANANAVGINFAATGSPAATTGTVYAINATTDIFRAQSPAIVSTLPAPLTAASDANPANVYMAYYDELTQEIRFRYGQVGALGGAVLTNFTDLGTKGTQLVNYVADIPATAYQPVASTALSGTTPFTTTTAVQPGNYLDLGVVGNGTSDVAVIAWYSQNDQKLYFSYNTSPQLLTTSGAQWQTNVRVVDTTQNTGQYVKLRVDSDGGIHIVYYSASGGDLKYAYLPSYHVLVDGGSAAIATVDSFLSVGTNCTIDVAKVGGNQVPYIGYSDNSIPTSARVAYRTDFTSNVTGQFDGADANSFYTGKWEISSVPDSELPIDAQVSVGVYRDSTGALAAIPTYANQTYGGGTPGKIVDAGNGWSCSETSNIYGNGTLNPAIGYAVKSNKLKLAQLK